MSFLISALFCMIIYNIFYNKKFNLQEARLSLKNIIETLYINPMLILTGGIVFFMMFIVVNVFYKYIFIALGITKFTYLAQKILVVLAVYPGIAYFIHILTQVIKCLYLKWFVVELVKNKTLTLQSAKVD